jgi:large subunit ribosomal protein L24
MGMRIKKGDTVFIKTGKDRGKTGKVLRVDPKFKKILVDGINVYKKHVRAKRDGEKGEVVSLSRPLAESNVLPYCSNCSRGVRVRIRVDEGKKVRCCSVCGTPFTS